MNGSGAGLQFDTLHSCPFQNRLFPSNRLGCSKKRNENQQSAVLQCSSEIHTFQITSSSTFFRPERPKSTPSVSAARVIRICRTRAVHAPHASYGTVARMISYHFTRQPFSEDPPYPRKQGLFSIFIPYSCSFRFYLGSFEKKGCQHIKGKSRILSAKCGICVHLGTRGCRQGR